MLLEIAGKPIWWIFLLIVPIVNFFVLLVVLGDLAKAFGKGSSFGVGLLLLPFIFYPILGFGDAEYLGAP